MPQAEGTTDYTYEDYASKLAVNRLPQTDALVNQTIWIMLDSGISFELKFAGRNQVIWESDDDGGTDWCEVVEVAPQTYFIDMTYTHQLRQSQTFIVNVQSRQVLAIRTIMRAGDIGKEPRAVHEFQTGVLGDPLTPPMGRKPGPTRDLIGLRALYDYGPEQIMEHIYLSSERYVWQGIIGPLRGEGDVDMSTVYKFDENQYILQGLLRGTNRRYDRCDGGQPPLLCVSQRHIDQFFVGVFAGFSKNQVCPFQLLFFC